MWTSLANQNTFLLFLSKQPCAVNLCANATCHVVYGLWSTNSLCFLCMAILKRPLFETSNNFKTWNAFKVQGFQVTTLSLQFALFTCKHIHVHNDHYVWSDFYKSRVGCGGIWNPFSNFVPPTQFPKIFKRITLRPYVISTRWDITTKGLSNKLGTYKQFELWAWRRPQRSWAEKYNRRIVQVPQSFSKMEKHSSQLDFPNRSAMRCQKNECGVAVRFQCSCEYIHM